MRRVLRAMAWGAVVHMFAGCGDAADPSIVAPRATGPRVAALEAAMEKLRPLQTPLGKPRPGDWLASHDETGQTFRQYLASKPVTPQGKRRVLYVQPLGDFDTKQRRVVALTADFLAMYYSRPVKTLDELPLAKIPARAQRTHPTWGDEQILSTYVLDELLKPKLPDDAAALIALTTSDLWPGEGWNFVFGQASLRDRVGVWSLYRNGDPAKDDESFRLCLLRSLKTASHEMGHMFSMFHCTRYECNMCGSNHREESDRRPLAACPECMAKICWATECDPAEWHTKLAEFCEQQKLSDEHEFFKKAAAALAE